MTAFHEEPPRYAHLVSSFTTLPSNVTTADLDNVISEVCAAGVKPELRHLATLPPDQFTHEYKSRMEKLVAKYNAITRSNARIVMDASAPCGYHLLTGTPAPLTHGVAGAHALAYAAPVAGPVGKGATAHLPMTPPHAASKAFFATPPELAGFGAAAYDDSFN